jgi:hypothetical protein
LIVVLRSLPRPATLLQQEKNNSADFSRKR